MQDIRDRTETMSPLLQIKREPPSTDLSNFFSCLLCTYCGFSGSDLSNHYIQTHSIEVSSQRLDFNCYDDFSVWKTQVLPKNSFNIFRSEWFQCDKGIDTCIFVARCEEEINFESSPGNVFLRCPSSVRAIYTEGSNIIVDYVSTHLGHEIEMKEAKFHDPFEVSEKVQGIEEQSHGHGLFELGSIKIETVSELEKPNIRQIDFISIKVEEGSSDVDPLQVQADCTNSDLEIKQESSEVTCLIQIPNNSSLDSSSPLPNSGESETNVSHQLPSRTRASKRLRAKRLSMQNSCTFDVKKFPLVFEKSLLDSNKLPLRCKKISLVSRETNTESLTSESSFQNRQYENCHRNDFHPETSNSFIWNDKINNKPSIKTHEQLRPLIVRNSVASQASTFQQLTKPVPILPYNCQPCRNTIGYPCMKCPLTEGCREKESSSNEIVSLLPDSSILEPVRHTLDLQVEIPRKCYSNKKKNCETSSCGSEASKTKLMNSLENLSTSSMRDSRNQKKVMLDAPIGEPSSLIYQFDENELRFTLKEDNKKACCPKSPKRGTHFQQYLKMYRKYIVPKKNFEENILKPSKNPLESYSQGVKKTDDVLLITGTDLL